LNQLFGDFLGFVILLSQSLDIVAVQFYTRHTKNAYGIIRIEVSRSRSKFMEFDGIWWNLMEFDGIWWNLMEFDDLFWWSILMVLAPRLSFSTRVSATVIFQHEILKTFWTPCIKHTLHSIQAAEISHPQVTISLSLRQRQYPWSIAILRAYFRNKLLVQSARMFIMKRLWLMSLVIKF
jgi:hypothetical protein